MKDILNRLIRHESLNREESRRVLVEMAEGKYNLSQMAAFVTIYLMRAIKLEELQGFRDAMLDLCVPVHADDFDAMDVCGTGGDGKDTFNISTISSFVVAGAGQAVVKHGNYGVSSICGSSNVLEYFGCRFTNDPNVTMRSLDQSGICFMHAPLFHPAMKHMAPVRKELGIKTFFNMLGPMVNPAKPRKQLVGVFSLELARMYGYIYQNTDKRFGIVHALDGYDEISLTGDFKLIDHLHEDIVSPADLELPQVKMEDLTGGDTVEEAATIFKNVLENKGTPAQEAAVLANAGMALAVASDLDAKTGVLLARQSLQSGAALKSFKKFIEINS
jgi:anthranilate phosphoribosyltransferase